MLSKSEVLPIRVAYPRSFEWRAFEVAGASHPSLPLIFIDIRSMLTAANPPFDFNPVRRIDFRLKT